ncbi:MAG TPA: DNA-deoxyinosine glycosylase [Candidatus Acidoferrum sp.]|nr:DNA-deoxyinosine glycosylase [Candidatus Acidoferrum sp.]
MRELHTFAPVYDENSRVLILGTMPSVKSREVGFYYGHPQNRFWRVLTGVFGEDVPDDIEGRKAFLLSHRVALWDVVASCEITGSSDASIKAVAANDIRRILDGSAVSRIYANGRTAEKLYLRHVRPLTGVDIIPLPSTSPANAAVSLEALVRVWRAVRP